MINLTKKNNIHKKLKKILLQFDDRDYKAQIIKWILENTYDYTYNDEKITLNYIKQIYEKGIITGLIPQLIYTSDYYNFYWQYNEFYQKEIKKDYKNFLKYFKKNINNTQDMLITPIQFIVEKFTKELIDIYLK